jgi:DNA invertase Pin-like site-specific DNA recombinase
MASIGYARVSTREQDFTGQQDALKKAGCARIFAEKITGRHTSRPELQALLDYVRAGDVVIVTRLDRLARNTRDLLGIAEQLQGIDVGLKSLAEPWADTTSPAGKMLLTILAGVAEFERGLIIERTTAGRQAAKERGVKFGPPAKVDFQKLKVVLAALEGGQTVGQIAAGIGVHPSTIYRHLAKENA